jgi:hypothetical protein
MNGDILVAQQVNVVWVDDLDGSTAAETVTFGLEGRSYEIDLSTENAAKLREALAPFVGAGRRDKGQRRPATARGPQRGTDREQSSALRQWARDNGMEVSDRGRISQAVIEAYENRNNTPAAAEAVVEAPKKRRRASTVTDPFQQEQAAS